MSDDTVGTPPSPVRCQKGLNQGMAGWRESGRRHRLRVSGRQGAISEAVGCVT